MLAKSLLVASIIVTPSSPAYHVMRAEDGKVVCTPATLTETLEIELNRKPWPNGISALRYTYRQGDINVTFAEGFPEEAKQPVLTAADILDSHLFLRVPLEVEVRWDEDAEGVAWGGPGSYSCTSWACRPIGLQNQISGRDGDPGNPDIKITIASNDFFHLSLDGEPPPDKVDLVTIVLHEIAHGLGFVSWLHAIESEEEIDTNSDEEEEALPMAELGRSSNGSTSLFDKFIWTYEHSWVEGRENPSSDLYKMLTSRSLFWGGTESPWRNTPSRSRAANGGPVLLWTTEDETNPSHLHAYAHYRSFMRPWLDWGEANHEPDSVVLGMLYDMGWELKDRGVDPADVLRCLEGR